MTYVIYPEKPPLNAKYTLIVPNEHAQEENAKIAAIIAEYDGAEVWWGSKMNDKT